MDSRLTVALIVFVAFLSTPLLAQQTRPAEGKFTEAQVRLYLDTQKDWLDENNKILHQATTTKANSSDLEVKNIGQLYQACLDRHHISRADFESLEQRVAEAYDAVAYLDGGYKTSVDEFNNEAASQNTARAKQQKRLAMYQEAQKNGWRVLSSEDRDAAVKSALAEQQSALDEVKRRAQDVSGNEAEAVQHEADAKIADDEGKNPPRDISPEDRAEYVANKKNEADAARASAKEARVEETDSKTEQTDAQVRADAAGERAAHPEIPITDDQKAQAKSDNAAAITTAQKEINDIKQRLAKIAKDQADLEKTAKAMTKNVPPENIEIMRRYETEYRSLLNSAHGTATTQSTR